MPSPHNAFPRVKPVSFGWLKSFWSVCWAICQNDDVQIQCTYGQVASCPDSFQPVCQPSKHTFGCAATEQSNAFSDHHWPITAPESVIADEPSSSSNRPGSI